MSEDWNFSEDEIRDKLAELGYRNIPREKLREFADDLQQLIRFESSSSKYSEGAIASSSATDTTDNTESFYSSTDEQTYAESPDERLYPRRATVKSTKKGLDHIPYGKENLLYTIKEIDTPTSDGTSVDYERPSHKMARKRKVLRRRNGEARVFDESFTSTDSGSTGIDISELEKQLRELPLSDPSYDKEVLQQPLGYRPWEGRQAGGALPSYIRPSTSHPHTRRIKKCDPVNRYRQFSREWEHKKVPGEKSRKSLRWNVRGQLLQCDVFERPRRRYVPNNYVVPTDKKRQTLRWQVRTNMARV